jgi:four helix bundle protein
LKVWQKALDLVEDIYRLTQAFPRSEDFRLTSQVCRSVVSVPANIAEGHGRASKRDFARYLAISKGSLMETETYVLLATRLGYLSATDAAPTLDLIVEIAKMLTALRARTLE